MKTCPLCQSVSFDDMEVCYGCLSHLEPKTATVELPKPTSATVDNDSVNPVIIPTITEPEAAIQPIQISEAITYPPKSSSSFSGMARLHVQMPQGYHYDIYLEKPEGASIQIGWVPDPLPSDSLPPDFIPSPN